MLKSAADHVRLRLPPAPKAAAAAAAAAAGEPLLCRRSSVLVVFVCELSFRYVLGKVQKSSSLYHVRISTTTKHVLS